MSQTILNARPAGRATCAHTTSTCRISCGHTAQDIQGRRVSVSMGQSCAVGESVEKYAFEILRRLFLSRVGGMGKPPTARYIAGALIERNLQDIPNRIASCLLVIIINFESSSELHVFAVNKFCILCWCFIPQFCKSADLAQVRYSARCQTLMKRRWRPSASFSWLIYTVIVHNGARL